MVLVNGKEYLSKQEYADAIEVNYATVTNYVIKGILVPAYVSGKRQFFTSEQVDAYWQGEYMPVRKKI